MFNLIYYICLVSIAFTNFPVQAKRVRLVELTNGWTLRNTSSTEIIDVAKIPSGVFTALKQRYGDLLQGRNDVELRWIANETWIYSTTFDDDELGFDNMVNLTLHGIDTVGEVRLNDQLLGHVDNMFVSYSFEVGHLLLPSKNKLEIELVSPLKHAKEVAQQLKDKGMSAPPECSRYQGDIECQPNLLRKMQMSFGGEWNPAAPSSGIWKTVVIEYYEIAILRNVDVAINQNGTHWIMDCRAILTSSMQEKYYAELTVYLSELLDAPFVVPQKLINPITPFIEFKVYIPKERIKSWWPNGYGTPKLYSALFALKSYRNAEGANLRARTDSQKLLKIGFRTIELIETEDNLGRTFYFRVNGLPIFMKGANYVPASTLPELADTSDTINYLLKSARDANMNMIRVWGGGLYESDTFYGLADYYGLLVWQDMTFSLATYPVNNENEASMRREASQMARRLAYHPSLALIVTNNEIELYLVKNRTDFAAEATRLEDEYKMLFMGTLRHELSTISRNDFNPRPGPMISTPSMGILESGKDLSKDPQNPNYGDVHFWDDDKNGFGPDIYPRARFISEFGYASLPLLSSWQRALGELDKKDNASLAALIRHRQHDPKGFAPLLALISYQLPFYENDYKWEENIEEFIYFSQVAQAMTAKTAVDLFRSLRSENQTMGALIWQLNDVWVAPTWSCIDFYGNYKLVHYWAKNFLAPLNVMALYDDLKEQIMITMTREDNGSEEQLYDITINTYLWNDWFAKRTKGFTIDLYPNGILQKNISVNSVLYEEHTVNETFLEVTMQNKDGVYVARTHFYPVAIKHIQGMKNPQLTLLKLNTECGATPPFTNSFSLHITVKYPALFVYLELNHPSYIMERHKFSENGFTQTEPMKTVYLEFENNSACFNITKAHIKIVSMNQYIIK